MIRNQRQSTRRAGLSYQPQRGKQTAAKCRARWGYTYLHSLLIYRYTISLASCLNETKRASAFCFILFI